MENGDHTKLQSLMNANFDLRRQLYGDNVLGAENIRMITLGRQVQKILNNITVPYTHTLTVIFIPTLTLNLTRILTLINPNVNPNPSLYPKLCIGYTKFMPKIQRI